MDTFARTPYQLGLVLRSHRAKLKLSQTDVGLKVGIKQDTVSVLEIRTSSSSVETLFKALSALGLELVVRERARSTPTGDEW